MPESAGAGATILVPNPLVYVGGRELPKDELDKLTEVRIEMELRLPGRVTLRFQDPDGKIALSSTFGVAKSVSIKIEQGPTIIDAEITGLGYEASTGAGFQPRFGGRTSDVNEFIVTAHDKAHRLTRTSTVAGLTQLKSSELVQRIAQATGLTPEVTSTTSQFSSVTQVYNDFELMNALADREGYDWWVGPGDKLYFKPPRAQTTATLELGTFELKSFSVSATGLRPDKVSVRGWDRDQQTLIKGEAEVSGSSVWPTDVTLVTPFKSAGGSYGGDGPVITAQLGPLPADSTSIAQGLADRIAAGSVVARGVGAGNPAIAIGSSVQIKGSKPVNGTYHVTKVEHIVRQKTGFETRFVAGDRTPTSLADVVSAPEQGQFPLRHHGVVTAVVSGLAPAEGANKDQTNMLRVAYKGIDENFVSAWARFVAVGAGSNGRGLVVLPEVGDEVLVAFENGNVHQPVVLGGLYSDKNAIDKWDVANGKVMSRRFISRQGHLIEIKDGDDDATRYVKINVKGKGGDVLLLLAGDKVELTTPAKEPVTIKSGDSKIDIASSGNITVEAPTITLKGTQKVSLQAPMIEVKADQQLSLDGGLKTDLKGTTVGASAEGPMTIKGMPVKVN